MKKNNLVICITAPVLRGQHCVSPVTGPVGFLLALFFPLGQSEGRYLHSSSSSDPPAWPHGLRSPPECPAESIFRATFINSMRQRKPCFGVTIALSGFTKDAQ